MNVIRALSDTELHILYIYILRAPSKFLLLLFPSSSCFRKGVYTSSTQLKNKPTCSIFPYSCIKILASSLMNRIVTFLIILIYRAINLIDWIISQNHGPEHIEGLPSKKTMGSKMTQGNCVGSVNISGPEPHRDAKRPLIKVIPRNTPKSIEAKDGRYAFNSPYVPF